MALIGVVSSVSSASCENPSTGSSFTCTLAVQNGTTIAVLYGCLSNSGSSCDGMSFKDSQGNAYSDVGTVTTECTGALCRETGGWTTATAAGNDTLTFTSGGTAYLGADVFDIRGASPIGPSSSSGGSNAGLAPSVNDLHPEVPGAVVIAGVIANEAQAFGAGDGYALIPGQPCSPCAQNDGGWQAAEYSLPGTKPDPSAVFTYGNSNLGWVELAMSFSPVAVSTSVSCGPVPFVAGTPSECTATETGAAPTGSVAWSSNATGTFSAKACTLSSGKCSVSYTPGSPSVSGITASYGGDSTNPATSGTFSLAAVKAAANVGVKCSPSSLAVGSTTTCAATVTGDSPAGTITWASSGVADFSPASTCTLSAGSCAVVYAPSSASASQVTISAIYAGDGDNNASSGTFVLSVAPAATSTSTAASTSSGTSLQGTGASTTSAPGAPSPTTSASSAGASSSSSISWGYVCVVAVVASIVALVGTSAGRNGRRPGTRGCIAGHE